MSAARKAAAKRSVPAPIEAAAPLTLEAELSLSLQGAVLGGERRAALLAEIGRCGSLSQAARAVGLSYKGAWDAVEHMSALAGEPLVERHAGGKGGGHTRLTPRGEQLVRNFELVREEHRRFVDRLNRHSDGLRGDYALLGAPALRTSARNQFAGTVVSIHEGAVNDEVELEVAGGARLVAAVTRDSREDLALHVGAKAFALVKASSVMLMTGDDTAVKLSARNRLAGRVERIVPGAVNSEVVLALPGGGRVAAVVTRDSVQALGLAPGATATALFKASSVILGVAG